MPQRIETAVFNPQMSRPLGLSFSCHVHTLGRRMNFKCFFFHSFFHPRTWNALTQISKRSTKKTSTCSFSPQVPCAENVRGHVAGPHPLGSGPVPPDRLDRLLLLHLEGDPLHGEGECSPTSGHTTCRIHQPLIQLLHKASELRGLS